MGETNNSAKVMDTCRQQSSVNGIEVTLFTPIGKLLAPYCFLCLSNQLYIISQTIQCMNIYYHQS